MTTLATSSATPLPDTTVLQARLHRAERMNRLKSLGLIMPLILFMVVVFLVPL